MKASAIGKLRKTSQGLAASSTCKDKLTFCWHSGCAALCIVPLPSARLCSELHRFTLGSRSPSGCSCPALGRGGSSQDGSRLFGSPALQQRGAHQSLASINMARTHRAILGQAGMLPRSQVGPAWWVSGPMIRLKKSRMPPGSNSE